MATVAESPQSRRDAGGSRTHFDRVATGCLAVWLQRHRKPTRSSAAQVVLWPEPHGRSVQRTKCNMSTSPGTRTPSCGFVDRRASITLARQNGLPQLPPRNNALQWKEYLARESNPVLRLRRPPCFHHTRKAKRFLNVRTWNRTRIRTCGRFAALRYTIGTTGRCGTRRQRQSYHTQSTTEPTTGFAPA